MNRSGSSFLGDMLSLPATAVYSFEPLRGIKQGDSALLNWEKDDRDKIVPTMKTVFSCDQAGCVSSDTTRSVAGPMRRRYRRLTICLPFGKMTQGKALVVAQYMSAYASTDRLAPPARSID